MLLTQRKYPQRILENKKKPQRANIHVYPWNVFKRDDIILMFMTTHVLIRIVIRQGPQYVNSEHPKQD